MSERALRFGPLDTLVGYQLRWAFLRSNQLFAAMAGELGLAPGQFGVLTLIGLNPGRTQREIADASGLDRSSLTQMLDLLARRGYVVRRPGPDRRSFSLHLTPAGDAARAQGQPKVLEHERLIRGALSAVEAKTLLKLLERVAVHPMREAPSIPAARFD